jgi:death-on-curing family protein
MSRMLKRSTRCTSRRLADGVGFAGRTADGSSSRPSRQASATYGGQFLHTSVFQMATAYAFHLAENQPFIDGNKRTALSCALLFLQLNGFTVSSDHNERMVEAMFDLGSRKPSKEDLAMMFEEIAEKTEAAR